ncbi:MAG: hypothetical protein V3574_02765 [Candidatus Moraniibacteriota bacterium]
MFYSNGEDNSNFSFHDNYMEFTDTGRMMVINSPASISDFSNLENNKYYALNSMTFREAGNTYDQNGWQSNFEPTANFNKRLMTDDDRTVEKYMNSIGESGTLNNFIDFALAQDRYDWDTRIWASVINDYIRFGFDMSEYTLVEDTTAPSNPIGLSIL